MATLGKWFFRYKGAALSTIYSGYANGCSNDAPGIITQANGSCLNGTAYHIVATARNNARYASDLSFSTCGSGAMTIIEATFTSDSSVTGITCAADAPKYDCINRACITNTTYNTPGMYGSLAECQSVCGTATCGGKCISNSEWAQIENLASQVRDREC